MKNYPSSTVLKIYQCTVDHKGIPCYNVGATFTFIQVVKCRVRIFLPWSQLKNAVLRTVQLRRSTLTLYETDYRERIALECGRAEIKGKI